MPKLYCNSEEEEYQVKVTQQHETIRITLVEKSGMHQWDVGNISKGGLYLEMLIGRKNCPFELDSDGRIKIINE